MLENGLFQKGMNGFFVSFRGMPKSALLHLNGGNGYGCSGFGPKREWFWQMALPSPIETGV
jgi:hypothetical protein